MISVYSLFIDRKWKGGLFTFVLVFSIGSSPTVELENGAKRQQPNVNSLHFCFNKRHESLGELHISKNARLVLVNDPNTRDWTNRQKFGQRKKRDRQSGSIVAIVTVTITDLVYIFIKNGNKGLMGLLYSFFQNIVTSNCKLNIKPKNVL